MIPLHIPSVFESSAFKTLCFRFLSGQCLPTILWCAAPLQVLRCVVSDQPEGELHLGTSENAGSQWHQIPRKSRHVVRKFKDSRGKIQRTPGIMGSVLFSARQALVAFVRSGVVFMRLSFGSAILQFFLVKSKECQYDFFITGWTKSRQN